MAPTPATAAGTADPTARNFDATATPHDSPSADLATIENVMARTIASRTETAPTDTPLPSTAVEVPQSVRAPSSRLPVRRPPPAVRHRDRHRRGRQRRVHADLDALLPRRHRPHARPGRRRDLAGQPGLAADRSADRLRGR